VSASLFHSVTIPQGVNMSPGPQGPNGPPNYHSSGTMVISPGTVLTAIIGCALFVTAVALIAFALGDRWPAQPAPVVGVAAVRCDALTAYQALLDNGTAPSDIAFAGESAGGGLAVATLVNARDHGLPLPATAYVMSPYADLTLAGTTMDTKRDADPLLSRENLQARVPDYTAGHDPALGLISPVFADLSGLPPLIIQAGTHEVLLDDAVRLARQAATADVQVTLDITPGVPHVFQAYYPILDEAAAALDRAGQLLSAHLASAERVTA
jgi:acetyl esterase/lipase